MKGEYIMSGFSRFMKQNKNTDKPNEFYAATKSLTEEDGSPLKWEFRRISSKEHEEIREECTIEVPVTGKPGVYRSKFKTNKYVNKLITESVVSPNLYDAELLESYGVNTPEQLLMEMVDDPKEYSELAMFVQKFQGLNVSFEDKVMEAKN